ncbi:putative bacteriocin export ABC transporter [Leuconostoc mesenteroides]|nr:putative bacteriocin export ABC transporter [Leuconostoc mesenteroides]
MASLISISNLDKSYKNKNIFSKFNLNVREGEIVAIIGPSGVGKSTLLNIIGFIDDFDSGEYNFSGSKNISVSSRQAQKIIRDDISYLFQNFALIESETVMKNLLVALKYKKESKKEKVDDIKKALAAVGLTDYENRYVYELSGGEQQRVAIARALIKPGRLLLADEPTGALDSNNRDEIIDLLFKANKLGKTVIIVTHDSVVAEKAHRVISLT